MSDTDDRNANLIGEIERRKEAAAKCRAMAERLHEFMADPIFESIEAACDDLREEADRQDEMADEYVLRLLKAERLQKITG